MKAENGNFDQWREDARFMCDQYTHTESRCDFYYNEVYIVKRNSLELQPQLDRWLEYREILINNLVKHYNRGQRWLIDDSEMLALYCTYLGAIHYYKFLAANKRESSSRG